MMLHKEHHKFLQITIQQKNIAWMINVQIMMDYKLSQMVPMMHKRPGPKQGKLVNFGVILIIINGKLLLSFSMNMVKKLNLPH